ncbi:MAG TPA: IPT/TIG domain-containing protein [Bryobacteraceae bacterium]|nr:IPT/TIG domain-containing protein [Bryobacteraceae bacterium]
MTPAIIGLLAAVLWCSPMRAEAAPTYSAASIVNSATNRPGPLAPNTIVTIYGTNLAYVTRALTAGEIQAGILPTTLSGTGVVILVGNLGATPYYISPTQINFLIPSSLIATGLELRVGLNGHYGPAVRLTLAEAAPGLFQSDPDFAVATRLDGSIVTRQSPTKPGEDIVVYLTGLGRTKPNPGYREIPQKAAPIERTTELRVSIGGVLLASKSVYYAGVTPGFAGLYQVNLRVPVDAAPNPEIRIGYDDQMSPENVRLPVKLE